MLNGLLDKNNCILPHRMSKNVVRENAKTTCSIFEPGLAGGKLFLSEKLLFPVLGKYRINKDHSLGAEYSISDPWSHKNEISVALKNLIKKCN